MKLLIAGAGIGGLTTALCLSQAGHSVSVFERANEFLEIGAGLQCGANAMHVLASLGLSDALHKLAVTPQRVDFRDFKTGANLHSMTLGDSYYAKYGAPYLHLHRADLHSVLLRALSSEASVVLHLNAQVQSYSEADDSVTLSLQDGRSFSGDCLIAADGVHSVIRNQLLGESRPKFTRNVAWRGVIPVSRLPKNWMDIVVSNFVGPKKHMVLYYLRDKQLANFVGVVEHEHWHEDSWVSQAPWSELKQDFSGWHDSVQSIINVMDKDQCYRWGLFNHAPFNNWSSQRVTLLGDAAHSTLPFMASGAAMAIEDARILQRSLDQEVSVEQGLQCYQRNRKTRTARIQKDSSQAGSLYHFESSLMRKAAFTALKVISSKKESFLPSYNANTVDLI